jgi:hypothetical protein
LIDHVVAHLNDDTPWGLVVLCINIIYFSKYEIKKSSLIDFASCKD